MKGDKCSFRHDINKRGKVTPSNPSPNSFMQQSGKNASKTRSPRGRSPSGRMSRLLSKDYLKGTSTNSFCEKWHPPECLFYKTKSGCRIGEKCSYAHRQADEQPSKKCKKNGDKSAVAMLNKHELYGRTVKPVVCRDTRHERHRPVVCNSSTTRQLGFVFQDMEPPKLSSILRKSSDTQKRIQRVKFTKAVAPHAKIRDLISVAPTLQNLRISLRKRQRVARARCPRSSVEAGPKRVNIQGEKQRNILLTFGT